jgi:hypothetical protein
MFDGIWDFVIQKGYKSYRQTRNIYWALPFLIFQNMNKRYAKLHSTVTKSTICHRPRHYFSVGGQEIYMPLRYFSIQ